MPDAPASAPAAPAVRAMPEPPRFAELPLTGDPLFDRAIRVVFEHEGYWSDDPNDPGGPTIWGVSLRFAKSVGDLDGDGRLDLDLDGDGDVDADDLRRMTPAQALALYRRMWWDRYGYGRLGLALGIKVFDLSVNMGATQAHKLLQRGLRAVGPRLVDDGVIGKATMAALGGVDQGAALAALRSEAAGFYRGLITGKPSFKRFEGGWLNRAYY